MLFLDFSTPSPPSIVTTTTVFPSQPTNFDCDTSGGYEKLILHVTNQHLILCVHVHFEELNWNEARNVCRSENADLAVPDSTLKAILLQQNLFGLDKNGIKIILLVFQIMYPV